MLFFHYRAPRIVDALNAAVWYHNLSCALPSILSSTVYRHFSYLEPVKAFPPSASSLGFSIIVPSSLVHLSYAALRANRQPSNHLCNVKSSQSSSLLTCSPPLLPILANRKHLSHHRLLARLQFRSRAPSHPHSRPDSTCQNTLTSHLLMQSPRTVSGWFKPLRSHLVSPFLRHFPTFSHAIPCLRSYSPTEAPKL
ncbi:hypothetical protein BU16DRAFT_310166 [Lophium mytilinum]|uniref:Uncharacterized protein n=1 Tax=Lophium mytilinum TaxID=390894 RepID=A0A6A6R3Q4_9PEZI|nr:hypothetical protein BU16DRAFT_310166 [Lophium mytilinum]